MSTCSPATSARCGHEIRPRRLFCSVDDDDDDAPTNDQLKTQLRDLERKWQAYKTSRSLYAPRHRRSRSATGTPSSAGTAVAPFVDLSVLRCTPKRLIYSLQHDGSGDSAGAVSVNKGGQLQLCDDASSVGSVGVKDSTSSPYSCSCPRHYAALRRCYSTSSSCSFFTASSSSPPAEEGVAVTEDA